MSAIRTPPSGDLSAGGLNASVVVIVKNGEATVARCIQSLLVQTRGSEIIVVDGNSSDATREIVNRFPVILVRAPSHDSYGISRNLGVRSASGEVILFMDADDLAGPTWCESLVRNFVNPHVGIVTVPRRPDKIQGWFMETLSLEYSGLQSVGNSYEKDWRQVTTKGTAWLKKAIGEAGGFDESMFFGTEDKDLAYRIVNLGYKVVEEPAEEVLVTPVGSVMNFLRDKFWRAGVGHGYFRAKHGLFRPPLSGIGSLALLMLGAYLFAHQWTIGVLGVPLAFLSSWRLVREGMSLYQESGRLLRVLAFILVKWVSRILEFVGFIVGFVMGWSMGRSKRSRKSSTICGLNDNVQVRDSVDDGVD